MWQRVGVVGGSIHFGYNLEKQRCFEPYFTVTLFLRGSEGAELGSAPTSLLL